MNCSGINSKAIYLAGVVKLHMGAVRPPGPSNRENHRKLLKWAQNYSQLQPQDCLIKAKQATRKSWKKWNLHQASLGWLDLLPRAVWPPVPSGKLLHGKPCNKLKPDGDFIIMLLWTRRTNTQRRIQAKPNSAPKTLGQLDHLPGAVTPPLPGNLAAGQPSTSHQSISWFTP
jgi:hypothetical protein